MISLNLTSRVTRIAARFQDLQVLQDAFADLRGLAIVQRRQAGTGTGIEEVRSRTVLDLQARADIANGAVVMQLDHEHARSTYVPLSVDQIEKDRKSTRLNSSHPSRSRMPSSA